MKPGGLAKTQRCSCVAFAFSQFELIAMSRKMKNWSKLCVLRHGWLIVDWTHRLRLRQLEVIISLSDTQNISHSAELLHMTQPALSKWLKELEADLGLRLFERHARGLRVTSHGQILRDFAVRICNELNRARQEMSALRAGSIGRAVIGASGAAIASVVPQAVLGLLSHSPAAQVEIVEGPMDRLVQQLIEREIDVAVGRPSSKYNAPDLIAEPLYEEQLHFAVRPMHPLAQQPSVSWNDLLNYRWVVWSRDTPVRLAVDAAFTDERRVMPRESIQSNSLLAAITLVTESDMVAVISERAINTHERWKMLQRLPLSIGPKSNITMYWRRDFGEIGAVSEVLKALRAIAQKGEPEW